MAGPLLPPNFDELVADAVRIFWATRGSGTDAQGGERGNVLDGKNLDGFLKVVTAVATHSGIPGDAIFMSGRKGLTLPGFFRPTKNWDVVIVYRQRLLAVLEFKSQVGSLGNNINNRSEEALGNATDLWAAQEHGAYSPENHKKANRTTYADPRRPFLGYLMVLEDSDAARRPRKAGSPHYNLFPEFKDASYAKRYQLLCERMMERNLYDAAALMLSPKTNGEIPGTWNSMSGASDVTNLFTELSARLSAAAQAISP
jgi:hypothetical protein